MDNIGALFVIYMMMYFAIKLAIKSAINESKLCNNQSEKYKE